jgi:hypothetical protein
MLRSKGSALFLRNVKIKQRRRLIMKKFIALVTTLFFLMVPTFSLAEGIEGTQPTGKDSSVKAKKIGKKAPRSKKGVKKVTKRTKHARTKAKKSAKQNQPMKDMGQMPANP